MGRGWLARRCFKKWLYGAAVCMAAVVGLASADSGQSAGRFGRYMDLFGPVVLPGAVVIENVEDATVHRTLAARPFYYDITAPAGPCEVRIWYLSAGDMDDGYFAVAVDGKEVVAKRACLATAKPKKGRLERAGVESVSFGVTVGNDGLRLRFPHAVDQSFAISAMEIRGQGGFELRIDCGGKEDYTDQAGVVWKADRVLPMRDVTIQLAANDKKNEWVNIADEILDKLEAQGIESVVKWDGLYSRRFSGAIADWSGAVYINLSGIGLWSYGGPGGRFKRADGGIYTACMLGISQNPYGPGFVLYSSHGFNAATYQVLSLDGKTFQNFQGVLDYGAADWTETPLKTVIAIGHHKGSFLVSSDGGKTFGKIENDQQRLSAVGVLPGGVLLRCFTGKGKPDAQAGIYLSRNLGKTWDRVSDIDVGNTFLPAVVYKQHVYIHSPAGLVVSDDAGKTWSIVKDSPAFAYPVQLAADDNRMLGFNPEGGFESNDRGRTWTKVLPAPPPPASKKFTQQHPYYDFAWDYRQDVVYAFAPDAGYRFVRSPANPR